MLYVLKYLMQNELGFKLLDPKEVRTGEIPRAMCLMFHVELVVVYLTPGMWE